MNDPKFGSNFTPHRQISAGSQWLGSTTAALPADGNTMVTTNTQTLSEIPGHAQPAVKEIIMLHEEIMTAARTSLDKAFRIGELLIHEKSRLDHGQWLLWLEQNVPFTDRCARNYMRLYEHREQPKLENVSDLTAAYRMLNKRKSPKAPTVIHADAEKLAADGSAVEAQTQTIDIEVGETPRDRALSTQTSSPPAPEPKEDTAYVRSCTPEPDATTLEVSGSKSIEVQLRELWNHAKPIERKRFLKWIKAESPQFNFDSQEPVERTRVQDGALEPTTAVVGAEPVPEPEQPTRNPSNLP